MYSTSIELFVSFSWQFFTIYKLEWKWCVGGRILRREQKWRRINLNGFVSFVVFNETFFPFFRYIYYVCVLFLALALFGSFGSKTLMRYVWIRYVIWHFKLLLYVWQWNPALSSCLCYIREWNLISLCWWSKVNFNFNSKETCFFAKEKIGNHPNIFINEFLTNSPIEIVMYAHNHSNARTWPKCQQ